ncbi:MAG: LysR family transcriptional regulator [Bacteroidetes bacterium]|nr:MAG: LysR family transcriptional regulator [Bacteroidota bacterium]
MDYTLHQLRIFQKIVETKSITKAAKELHLSQPAVSIQLKKLQDQFEVPLTEIIGRQLYITAFGEEIAVASRRILEEVHAIKHKTLAFRGQLTGQLKFSIVSTGKYVMPYFLSDFLRQHLGIDLVMDVTNKAQVVQSLENNKTDFAMVSVLPSHLQIERLELLSNKLYLVGSPRMDYDRQNFDLEILKTSLLIYRENGSATRQQMENFITQRELPTTKRMELTSNEAVKQAVVAGLGYSILPLIGIRNEIMNGSIEVIPLAGLPITTSWNLIWSKGKNFSPAANAFLAYLRQEKDQIIEEKFNWFESFK